MNEGDLTGHVTHIHQGLMQRRWRTRCRSGVPAAVSSAVTSVSMEAPVFFRLPASLASQGAGSVLACPAVSPPATNGIDFPSRSLSDL